MAMNHQVMLENYIRKEENPDLYCMQSMEILREEGKKSVVKVIHKNKIGTGTTEGYWMIFWNDGKPSFHIYILDTEFEQLADALKYAKIVEDKTEGIVKSFS